MTKRVKGFDALIGEVLPSDEDVFKGQEGKIADAILDLFGRGKRERGGYSRFECDEDYLRADLGLDDSLIDRLCTYEVFERKPRLASREGQYTLEAESILYLLGWDYVCLAAYDIKDFDLAKEVAEKGLQDGTERGRMKTRLLYRLISQMNEPPPTSDAPLNHLPPVEAPRAIPRIFKVLRRDRTLDSYVVFGKLEAIDLELFRHNRLVERLTEGPRKEGVKLERRLLNAGNLSPKNFEKLVADSLGFFGFRVERRGGPGEVDINVYEPLRMAVECKSIEDVSAVTLKEASMELERLTEGESLNLLLLVYRWGKKDLTEVHTRIERESRGGLRVIDTRHLIELVKLSASYGLASEESYCGILDLGRLRTRLTMTYGEES